MKNILGKSLLITVITCLGLSVTTTYSMRMLPPGESGLNKAVWANRYQEVEKLIKQGVSVNSTGSRKWTPLITASFWGNERMVRLLLAHGATVNNTDMDGCTALFWATAMGHHTIVKLLLEHKAQVECVNAFGNSALQEAQFRGDKPTETLLLEALGVSTPAAKPTALSAPEPTTHPKSTRKKHTSLLSTCQKVCVVCCALSAIIYAHATLQ